MKHRIQINGFLIFLAVVITISLHKFTLPQWRFSGRDELMDIFGFSLLVLGFAVRICARGYKADISRNGHVLVTNGPYAFVCHPMYLGTLLVGTGITLVIFNWWLILLFFFIFFLRFSTEMHKEEKRLLGQFGKKYLAYTKSVPKLIPRFATLVIFHRFFPFKWQWLKKEISSVILAPLLTLIIEGYEDIKLFKYSQFFRELILLLSINISLIVLLSFFRMNTDRLFYKSRNYKG